MIQYNAVFELFQKLDLQIFESGKSRKEQEKLQKFEYLENKKSFLDEIKNVFHSF